MINTKLKYLNKRFQCNNGEYFTVIEYNNAYDITIQFDDGTIVNKKQSSAINNGKIKNPNLSKNSNSIKKSICKIGFIGIGKFNTLSNNGLYYKKWNEIIKRNFSKNKQLIQPTYINCSVDPIWHNFQNFCLWCENPINGYKEGFAIDKDILIKGNKIYGPETCCFVPQEINNLFCKSNKVRGQYPIGVNFNKLTNKFQSQLSINRKTKYLGSFDTIEKAFQIYKEAKEAYIKEVADKWKNKITDKVYQALYNYQVEITD